MSSQQKNNNFNSYSNQNQGPNRDFNPNSLLPQQNYAEDYPPPNRGRENYNSYSNNNYNNDMNTNKPFNSFDDPYYNNDNNFNNGNNFNNAKYWQ